MSSSVCVTIVGSDNLNINQFSCCWESEIPLLALYSNKYQRWIGFGLDCWLLFSASERSIILNLNNTRKNPAQKIIYHVHVIPIITTCSLPIFYKASIFSPPTLTVSFLTACKTLVRCSFRQQAAVGLPNPWWREIKSTTTWQTLLSANKTFPWNLRWQTDVIQNTNKLNQRKMRYVIDNNLANEKTHLN